MAVNINGNGRRTKIDVSPFTPEEIKDFSNWKDKIIPVLVKASDAAKIQNAPINDFLDLKIIYYGVKDMNDYSLSMLITNPILEDWGLDAKSLNDLALSNLNRQVTNEGCVKPMFQVLGEMLNMEFLGSGLADEYPPLFVCTNANMTKGAAVAFLNTRICEAISAKFDTNVYIIPCSIHESIVLPASAANMDTDYLKEMVHSVNRTELLPEEDVLSDNVYLFDKASKTISILA